MGGGAVPRLQDASDDDGEMSGQERGGREGEEEEASLVSLSYTHAHKPL